MNINIKEYLTHAKHIICALFALILPFVGIGVPELGAKGPTDTEVVRIMSFMYATANLTVRKLYLRLWLTISPTL